ncbi:MAG TPA: cytochrome c [Terriglobia bacterium]|nr:cytochrome c [Terriglobia bacterium]
MRPSLLIGAVLALGAIALAGWMFLREDGAAADPGDALGSPDPASRVEQGRIAYFKHCVACHSPDTDEYIAARPLKGYFKGPPTPLSDGTLFPRTDEAIRELVAKGTKNMPPLLQGITPQEMEDILTYMHTL